MGMILLIYFQNISFITFHFFHEYTHNANKYYVAHQGMSVQRAAKSNHWPFLALICKPPPDHSPVCTTKLTDKLQQELEGKYSLESTDPRESEFAPTCVHNSLLSHLSWGCATYLLLCWFVYIANRFVYIGKFAGLRHFWTVKSTPS